MSEHAEPLTPPESDPNWGMTDEELASYPLVYRDDLFAGKTVIVSGGGSGIGKGIAYLYARLGAQVIICSRCDRGQRYCAGVCRHEARSESTKRSTKKYQSTRTGRFNNAARQQRFRQRKQQKVTHQGSTRKVLHDLLKVRLEETKKTQKRSLPGTTCYCHHCGAVCDPFLRLDFLHSRRFKSSQSQNHQPETS